MSSADPSSLPRVIGSEFEKDKPPIRVALVLAGFPLEKATAFKYFLLLLNRLQRVFEFQFHDAPEDDELVAILSGKEALDSDEIREQLLDFAERLKADFDENIEHFDLSSTYASQIILISLATMTDLHFIVRKEHVSLLALGEWDRSMSPPSAAEFLQVAMLRAAYSAMEGGVWNTIHQGTRGCIFDFTNNLEDTRLMMLVGLGVCFECRQALVDDGYSDAPEEIRRIVERTWLGSRNIPGTPANIMAQFGYDLFFSKGFTSTWRERLRQSLQEDAAKELIKLFFGLMLAGLLLWLGLKE